MKNIALVVLTAVLLSNCKSNSDKINSNNEDLHEHSIKIFKPDAIDFLSFNPTVENTGRTKHYLKNERTICAFHPRVPTPPPNA